MRRILLVGLLFVVLITLAACLPAPNSLLEYSSLEVVKMESMGTGSVVAVHVTNSRTNSTVSFGFTDDKLNLDKLGVVVGKRVTVRCFSDFWAFRHDETCRIVSVEK